MKTILIIWAVIMLVCSHAIAYNIGAINMCDKIDKGLKKAAKEIKNENRR